MSLNKTTKTLKIDHKRDKETSKPEKQILTNIKLPCEIQLNFKAAEAFQLLGHFSKIFPYRTCFA